MVRAFLLLTALLLAATPSAVAQDQSTPHAVVSEIYSYYNDNGSMGVWPTDPTMRPLFTDRLMALFDADDAMAERDGMGRLNFDPFVNAQDFALENLSISTLDTSGNEARVQVSFENFGQPMRLVYRLERDAEGSWRIADLEAPDGPYPWRLGDILSD